MLLFFRLPYIALINSAGTFVKVVIGLTLDGCMRIERPVDLAAYLLHESPRWTVERIVAESQKGVEHTVAVPNPLPVHVLYWTAFLDEAGELHFAPDVYDRDDVLDRAMRKPAPRI